MKANPIEIINNPEMHGRPVWAEAMIWHCHDTIHNGCTPVLHEIESTFKVLFYPHRHQQDTAPYFRLAVKAVIDAHRSATGQFPSFEFINGRGEALNCQIASPDCLAKLMRLVYGMRCLGSHGSAEKTLFGKGVLSSDLGDFAADDVANSGVAELLNKASCHV